MNDRAPGTNSPQLLACVPSPDPVMRITQIQRGIPGGGAQWEGVIGNALYLFEYRVANLHMAPAGQSTDTDCTSTCPGRQPSQPALHRRRGPTQNPESRFESLPFSSYSTLVYIYTYIYTTVGLLPI